MRERVCFIHVGTHKTGTTALQQYLSANEEWLRTQGVCFPRCGRMHPNGHHNVAFELVGDERYQQALGGLQQLLGEVETAALPRACISSEAFGFLHDRPDGLAALRDGFAAIGYRAVVIAYLRSQAGYLESLYPTLVHLGYADSFAAYVERALTDGGIRFRGVRSYCFDYDTFLDCYERAFGPSNLLVRRYENTSDPTWIVRNFFDAIGPPTVPVERAASAPAVKNARPHLAEVVRTLLRNRGHSPTAAVSALLERAADMPFEPFDAFAIDRVTERFAAGNRRVARRWGVHVEPVSSMRDARSRAAEDARSPQHAARVLFDALDDCASA